MLVNLRLFSIVIFTAFLTFLPKPANSDEIKFPIRADNNLLFSDDWKYIEVEHANGTKKLSDFQGQNLIIKFWATWCKYCQIQMPAFDVFAKKIQEPDANIKVIAVSIDRDGLKKAQNFIDSFGYKGFELYSDKDGKLMKALDLNSVPSFVVISKAGAIIGIYKDMRSMIAVAESL